MILEGLLKFLAQPPKIWTFPGFQFHQLPFPSLSHPPWLWLLCWQPGDPSSSMNTQNCVTQLCLCSHYSLPFPRLLLLHLDNCAGPSRFGVITLAGEDASSLCFNITLSILNIYFCDFFLMSYMRAEMSRSYFCITRISHSAWHAIRTQ